MLQIFCNPYSWSTQCTYIYVIKLSPISPEYKPYKGPVYNVNLCCQKASGIVLNRLHNILRIGVLDTLCPWNFGPFMNVFIKERIVFKHNGKLCMYHALICITRTIHMYKQPFFLMGPGSFGRKHINSRTNSITVYKLLTTSVTIAMI